MLSSLSGAAYTQRFDPVQLRWAAHCSLSKRLRFGIPYRPQASPHGITQRVLILTEDSAISRSQIFPFYFYREELARRYGAALFEQNVDMFLASGAARDERADVVLVQPWFTCGAQGVQRLLDAVRKRCRPERLIFLDSAAPTDLRFAASLVDSVDVYVKKHVLRDRSAYGKPTRGDTNLTDYFSRRYALPMPEVTFEVPAEFLKKLVIGPSFATAPYMLGRFLQQRPRTSARRFDVHARLGGKGVDWYEACRAEALSKVRALADISVLTGTAPFATYLRELATSKICFSPFGYGEVAWRDYEAALCGALLIKPNMDHVETTPNIFVANETYVPVRWDLADLEEKVRYYLEHEDARRQIVERAFAVLHDYFERQGFLEQVAPLFT